jgi:hypothetical protein
MQMDNLIWSDGLDSFDEYEHEQMLRGVCFGRKGGGSQPTAPDPAATAAAQGQANKEAVRESALVNQIGTQGPWGKTYYTGEVGAPDRTQVTELSPESQAVYNSQQNIAQGLAGYGEQLAGQVAQGPAEFTLDGLPAAPWEGDRSDMISSLEDATYQRGYNLLQPEFERSRDSLETRLANQGITMGSDAYNTELSRFDDSKNRALTDLSLAAVNAGRAEDSRLFGLGQSGRSQALGETLTERTQPMNELAAILQGSPALGAPQGVNPGQYGVQPGDIQGATNAAYQGALMNAQASQAASQGLQNNLFGLGGTLAAAYMMSDRRLKTSIRKIGQLANGLGVYTYRYIFGTKERVGLMADEVRAMFPHAVHSNRGYLSVDYDEVMRAI